MGKLKVSRRRFVANTAALSSAMVAAPFVRGAYAAGKLAIGFWDHWVPGANKGAETVARAWAEKEKVDLQIDFITSQGNKLILTAAAESQARSGHDILAIGLWDVGRYSEHLTPVDDIMAPLVKQNGAASAVSQYLGRIDGKWLAVPATPGAQMKGPACNAGRRRVASMVLSTSPRQRMVRRQIAGRGVADLRVLAAMDKVPRETFLPEALHEFAYEDTPLPIEEGQTISQPYIVARMAEAARVGASDRVLEIGAGSGYAAAVLGELAQRVFTIERHAALAALARARLKQLGYANVEVRTGDGTLGWPEESPFDAIIVTAGGPRIPNTLSAQLAVGGRLVMPVGRTRAAQVLFRITRTDRETWHTEQIEEVRFVPLVGEQGWADGQPEQAEEAPTQRPSAGLPQLIRAAARPLTDIDDPDFAAPFDRYADRTVVLLGEASHGTSEFYRARAAITRRLIEHHDYDLVAVEADWPDALAIDRHIRHLPVPAGAPPAFRRFPTWMWRNAEVEAFVEWLRDHNRSREPGRQAGFFGLDIYSLADSIAGVLAWLDKVDPEAAAIARERYGCLTPWQHNPAVYGRAVLNERYRQCEAGAVETLRDLLARRLDYAHRDGERFFDVAQNARLVAAAERYYRALYYANAESWNLRDRHMFDTLQRLLEHRGANAKAVVWAHNSHIGDARFTDLGRVRGELNLGELCRRRFADRAALIGFGTHSGTVAAASSWDGPMEVKDVRPSRQDSIERQFHDAGLPRSVLHLDTPGELRRRLRAPRPERFIGVVYRPETELQSHYAEVELPGQFDAFVWFDRTSALTPLPAGNPFPRRALVA